MASQWSCNKIIYVNIISE